MILARLSARPQRYLALQTSYDPAIVEQLKTAPGCRWEKKEGVWVGPQEAMLPVVERLAVAKIITSPTLPNVGSEIPSVGMPPGFEKLYNYQKAGVQYMLQGLHQYGAVLLADDLGLGKTAQTAVAITAAGPLFGSVRWLIVCPAVVARHWADECERWIGVKAVRFDGNKTKAKVAAQAKWAEEGGIAVCSWDGLRSAKVAGEVSCDVVLDELHYAANPKALRSKAVRNLIERQEVRPLVVGLTGTPITARPRDLFNPLDLLYPKRFGKFFDFGRRYCTPGDAPIWMGDFTFKPISEVRVGDEVIGWDESSGGKQTGSCKKRLRRSRVTAVHRTMGPLVKVTFASGRTLRCTPDHQWLPFHCYSRYKGRRYNWVTVITPYNRKPSLSHVISIPPNLPAEKLVDAAWLGGMFDGEGTGSRIAQSPTANEFLYQELGNVMRKLGLPCTPVKDGYNLTGGRQAAVNFINWCRPRKRSRHLDRRILGAKLCRPDKIIRVEADDQDAEVFGLTTETGNYIAYGFASRNCAGAQVEIQGLDRPVWDFNGASNLEELGRRLKDGQLMLRRVKSEVLELPERQRILIPVELPASASKALANAMVLTKSDGQSVSRALAAIEEHKTQAAIDLAKDLLAAGKKVLLFTLRKQTAKVIGEALLAPVVDGETDSDKRAEQLCSSNVGVATIYSASTGLDGLQRVFDCAIFVGLDWVPSTLMQAEGRIHRIGQGSSCTFYYLIGLQTVDEVIRSKVVERLGAFEQVVGNAPDEAALAGTLTGGETEEDLLASIIARVMEGS